MKTVRIREYTAGSKPASETLDRVTRDEMEKSIFPTDINVLIDKLDGHLPFKVVAIEPEDSEWNWPDEKFGEFKPTERLCDARILVAIYRNS
jgi:hypothetical protein